MPVSASLGPGSSSWCRTRGTLSKDLRTGVMRSSTESSEQDKQAALPWQTWIAGPLEARSSSLINTVTHILLLKPSPPLPSWPGQITSERLLLSTLITLLSLPYGSWGCFSLFSKVLNIPAPDEGMQLAVISVLHLGARCKPRLSEMVSLHVLQTKPVLLSPAARLQ